MNTKKIDLFDFMDFKISVESLIRVQGIENMNYVKEGASRLYNWLKEASDKTDDLELREWCIATIYDKAFERSDADWLFDRAKELYEFGRSKLFNP